MPIEQFKVSFTSGTLERLRAYVVEKYGTRRAMSITIEQAVKEYLDRMKETGTEG